MIYVQRITFFVMAVTAAFFLWLGNEQSRFESGNYTAAVYPQPGHEAPSFEAETFNSDTFIFTPGKERPAVIYFWTSWCPYCQASSQAMENAYDKYGDEVAFIGVNATASDRERDARSFIDEHDLTFVNAKDHGGGIAGSYYVPPVPTTVFVDGNGIITHRKTGGITPNEIESHVLSLKEE